MSYAWIPYAASAISSLMGGRSGYDSAGNAIQTYATKQNLKTLPSSFVQGWSQAGIHPLAALGGGTGMMHTVPLQKTQAGLEGMSSALNQIGNYMNQNNDMVLDRRIKQETLAALVHEAKNRKWDSHILIPVKHKDYPGKQFWGFNPKYQMFGSLSQAIVIAGNKKEAMDLLIGDLPETEQQRIKSLQKRIETIPVEKQDNQYGTDIAP